MSSSETNATQLDDPEMGATWFYAFVGIVVFIVFVLGVSVLFFGVQRDFTDVRVVDEKPLLAETTRNEQQGLLGQYDVYAEEVDDKKVDRIRIPIERAMELKAAKGK
jgi:hypothetical protein